MASMQFWGIEVKGKEPSSVKLEECQVIHISQATLGEVKKDNEPVMIHVKVGAQKLVMGILSQSNPQLSFDLVFDKDFEISHNWKNGSIHLLGYESDLLDDKELSDFSDDEDVPTLVPLRENGKPVAAALDAAKSAPKTNKDNKPKPEEKVDDEEDSEESDDDNSDEDMLGGNDESDEDDDSDEETPKVSAVGKKISKPDAKTHEPETKKAKLATLQISEGKKGINTATPQPLKKKAEKTPGANNSTTKSGGRKK